MIKAGEELLRLQEEKQAAIYHGCHDCEYQPEPLMTCDWLHHQTTIFVQCPRWKARMTSPEQRE